MAEIEKSKKAELDAYLAILKMLSKEKAKRNVQNGVHVSSNSSSSSGNSNSSTNKKRCTACKPSDDKGWSIKDYDEDKKIFTNFRNIKNIGYKPCSTCYGTGNCKASGRCSDIWNDKDNKCIFCHGDRWEMCNSCRGEGYVN